MSRMRIIIFSLIIVAGLLFLFRNTILVKLFYMLEEYPAADSRIPLPELNPAQEQQLTEYLQAHFQNPQEYVLSKFDEHDIVFLGEEHRFRHDPLFVQNLIPLLYKRGIYMLGMEFACFRDQNKIDSLLSAESYDQDAVHRILFNFMIFWGFREYADIFKAVWNLNHSLPASARKFRIIGLNPYINWSWVQSEEDRRNPKILARVFADGRGDEAMGKTVLREIVAKNEKALIYCGMHHAFTRYKQPIVHRAKKTFERFIENRMGNIVYQAVGERAFTISLHQPWETVEGEDIYPVGGTIDALMHTLGPRYYPVGFDTRGTPFGQLRDTLSFYRYGYEDFTLSDFCDGYIFTMPFSQYKGVTIIDGFINDKNFEEARLRISSVERKNSFLWKILSPEAVNAMFMIDAAKIENRMSWFY